MQFLKTLFWVAFAVAVVLFARANWFPVSVKLWGGLELDVKLPVLVFGAFIVGLLPTLVLYRARLWSLRRRLEAHERNIIAAQQVPASPGITAEPRSPVTGESSPSTSTVSPVS